MRRIVVSPWCFSIDASVLFASSLDDHGHLGRGVPRRCHVQNIVATIRFLKVLRVFRILRMRRIKRTVREIGLKGADKMQQVAAVVGGLPKTGNEPVRPNGKGGRSRRVDRSPRRRKKLAMRDTRSLGSSVFGSDLDMSHLASSSTGIIGDAGLGMAL